MTRTESADSVEFVPPSEVHLCRYDTELRATAKYNVLSESDRKVILFCKLTRRSLSPIKNALTQAQTTPHISMFCCDSVLARILDRPVGISCVL